MAGRCSAPERWCSTALIRSRPSGVVGPVGRPPRSRQRQAPRFVWTPCTGRASRGGHGSTVDLASHVATEIVAWLKPVSKNPLRARASALGLYIFILRESLLAVPEVCTARKKQWLCDNRLEMVFGGTYSGSQESHSASLVSRDGPIP
jgi:hypothetical protein